MSWTERPTTCDKSSRACSAFPNGLARKSHNRLIFANGGSAPVCGPSAPDLMPVITEEESAIWLLNARPLVVRWQHLNEDSVLQCGRRQISCDRCRNHTHPDSLRYPAIPAGTDKPRREDDSPRD